jgi:hypothetical protein
MTTSSLHPSPASPSRARVRPPSLTLSHRHAVVRRAGRQPSASRRFGYLVAIGVNVAFLYVVHQLLDWRWPSFLTDDFSQLLPVITASIVATIVANVLFLWYDREWFMTLANVVTAILGCVVAVRTWQVFPFDFSTFDRDWTAVVQIVLVVAMLGTAIAALVGVGRLLTMPFRSHADRDG